MTNIQKTLVGVFVMAGVGTGLFQVHEMFHLGDQVRMLQEHQSSLPGQIHQLEQEENDLYKKLAVAQQENEQLRKHASAVNAAELLKLRGEVGALRREKEAAEKSKTIRGKSDSPPAKATQSVEQLPADRIDSRDPVVMAKLSDARALVASLVSPDMPGAQYGLSGSNQFERVAAESLAGITNPATTIVLREKESSIINGKRVKTYGFADGHSELIMEPEEGFDAWEKQHMISPSPNP